MTQLGLFDLEAHPLFQDLAPHVVRAFLKHHKKNPQLFELFERFSLQALHSGRKKFGIQAIAERIRWHVQIETHGDDFKICNSHMSCYARLLIIKNPALAGLFVLRRTPGHSVAEDSFRDSAQERIIESGATK